MLADPVETTHPRDPERDVPIVPSGAVRSVLLAAALASFLVACARTSTTPTASASPTPTLRAVSAPTPSPTLRTTPMPATAPLRYVAIGASDTVGVGATDPATKSWPALLHRRMPAGTAYVNLGVGGSTVAQAIVQQLPEARQQREADVITVWLAVNDMNRGIDPLGYRNDLGRLLDGLLSATARARIFVGTVPDLTLVPAYAQVEGAALAARIAAYNEAVRDVARARPERVVVVDLFSGSDVITREAVVAPDGFHPSDRGYELIAERFADTLRAAGVAVR